MDSSGNIRKLAENEVPKPDEIGLDETTAELMEKISKAERAAALAEAKENVAEATKTETEEASSETTLDEATINEMILAQLRAAARKRLPLGAQVLPPLRPRAQWRFKTPKNIADRKRLKRVGRI